jgi:hypothetical protein
VQRLNPKSSGRNRHEAASVLGNRLRHSCLRCPDVRNLLCLCAFGVLEKSSTARSWLDFKRTFVLSTFLVVDDNENENCQLVAGMFETAPINRHDLSARMDTKR